MRNLLRSTLQLAAALACASALAQPTPDTQRPRYTQVEGFGGVPLNVLSKGDPQRPAVLLIHGYRQSTLSWQAQLDSELAEHCQLVAFDLRGHGNSGRPWQPEAYNRAEPWGDDVARVIRAAGLQRPLIVAWSFGGNVALDFVRQHPELPIAGLVLVGSNAGLVPSPAMTRPPGAPLPPSASADLLQNIQAAADSVDYIYGKALAPELRQRYIAATMRVDPYYDRSLLTTGVRSNIDLVPRLTMPITLVLGASDPVVPPAAVERLKVLLPKARVEMFTQSGHAPFLDESAAFNRLIDSLHCSPGR